MHGEKETFSIAFPQPAIIYGCPLAHTNQCGDALVVVPRTAETTDDKTFSR